MYFIISGSVEEFSESKEVMILVWYDKRSSISKSKRLPRAISQAMWFHGDRNYENAWFAGSREIRKDDTRRTSRWRARVLFWHAPSRWGYVRRCHHPARHSAWVHHPMMIHSWNLTFIESSLSTMSQVDRRNLPSTAAWSFYPTFENVSRRGGEDSRSSFDYVWANQIIACWQVNCLHCFQHPNGSSRQSWQL